MMKKEKIKKGLITSAFIGFALCIYMFVKFTLIFSLLALLVYLKEAGYFLFPSGAISILFLMVVGCIFIGMVVALKSTEYVCKIYGVKF